MEEIIPTKDTPETMEQLEQAMQILHDKAEEYERLLSQAQGIAKELKKTKFKVEFDYGEETEE
ncbi:hypothetical protein C7H83_10160 [Tetragenococcus halophilus]|uniref:Uncharacterized protein n=1 Tax=Tetragenococcus halophilus TaxID=51669 RepID=A0A3G5FKE8_TETHA|nr:hypothetical protein [Tetragenococcus halophilus]AYW50804.1 hypothetical protein C7H83_10160 [Tetragenococcus halophilus]GBD64887.1 hypothetical protein TEHD23766T_2314 [Tetragenococcus halophilus subsp. flandriensis]GMA08856.1 hypothetical protein GCM10025886_20070 [Tetragenococcus halophilus subsp. flandriensis]